MKVTLRKTLAKPSESQTLVLFAHKKEVSLPKLDPGLIKLVRTAATEGAFSGKRKETIFFRQASVAGFRHLLVVGTGESKNISAEEARVAAGVAVKALQAQKIAQATFDFDSLSRGSKNAANQMRAVVEGALLCAYEFKEFKSKPKKNDEPETKLLELAIETRNLNKSLQKGFEEGEILAEETNFARELGDRPANALTPSILAEKIQARAKGSKLKVTVWDKARIKKENFGGLWGVGNGSDHDPRFIIMEYYGAAKSAKPVCLVGKGLTFDSGGISIKPSAAMDEMRYDMSGAGAVTGAMFALAKLKAKVNVMAFIASAENMPSGRAAKPGDIFVHRNGKTSEVLNTDAEGRLVLADALAYASEQKPQAIFDAATLTGAIVVALGNTHTGLFTRDEKLVKRIAQACEASGEAVWPMPLTDDHLEDMRGAFADLSNISSTKGAGSATAAAFLGEFVDREIPYAHFDIAGTAWNVANRLPYIARKGASGVMVRTFVELAKSYF